MYVYSLLLTTTQHYSTLLTKTFGGQSGLKGLQASTTYEPPCIDEMPRSMHHHACFILLLLLLLLLLVLLLLLLLLLPLLLPLLLLLLPLLQVGK